MKRKILKEGFIIDIMAKMHYTPSKSTVFGLSDHLGSCNQGKISSTIWFLYWDQLCLNFSCKKCFCFFLGGIMIQFELIKHRFLNSFVLLSNYTWREIMHNVSVHQLPWHYQSQLVPGTAWTASVMWYIHSQLLQNFWLNLLLWLEETWKRCYCTVLLQWAIGLSQWHIRAEKNFARQGRLQLI